MHRNCFYPKNHGQAATKAFNISFTVFAMLALQLVSLPSFGQEIDEFGSGDVSAFSKKVQRNYLGGREEDDLKVQLNLPQPIRALEVKAVEGAVSSSSAD